MKRIFSIVLIFYFSMLTAISAEENVLPQNTTNVQVYTQKGKFGLVNKKTNIEVTKPIYKKLIKLGHTAWIVQKRNDFGIINYEGKMVVEPKFSHADRIFGRYAKLGNTNDYGLFDEFGNAILKNEYSLIDPLYSGMFLTCKNYKYGLINKNGKVILDNDFDNIYMPSPTVMRVEKDGQWVEIEKMEKGKEIEIPEGSFKVSVDDKSFKITELVENTGIASGYSVVTFTDYLFKIFSSISPAYEDTIDELMFSNGADGVTMLMKCSWIPKFPIVYVKKYADNFKAPIGPLNGVKTKLRRKLY